ncbi:MAG: DUF1761 family protein [Alphaproteobacteria bacterium]|nr:DUF1761 family protein [Alphaproteobacteria bacterium]
MTPLNRLRLLHVLVAALAMFLVGFLTYGVAFRDLWSQQTLIDRGLVSPAEAVGLTGGALTAELARIPSQLPQMQSIALGFIVYFLTAAGLSVMLRLARPASLAGAVRLSFVIWAAFAATTLAYNVVYSSESRILFMLDLGHLLVGYLLAGVILFSFDRSAAKRS